MMKNIAETDLFCDSLNDAWEEVVLGLAMFLPRSEVPKLPVVAIVRKPHLGSNKKDLSIVYNNSAVVYHILVLYRPGTVLVLITLTGWHIHSDIAHDALRLLRIQDLGQYLP